MIPLTILLRKEKFGYRFTKDTSCNILNHLLFMYDLKLYGRNEEELERLVEIVHIYSNDVDTEFGKISVECWLSERVLTLGQRGLSYRMRK